jgi:homoserine acetyltransferase
MIGSPYGHDGFLIEIGEVGALVRDALASTRVSCG